MDTSETKAQAIVLYQFLRFLPPAVARERIKLIYIYVYMNNVISLAAFFLFKLNRHTEIDCTKGHLFC